jgi:5'-3' exonuclease
MSDSGLSKYADLLKQIRIEHETNSNPSDINDRILIIDGLNLFIRVFSAVPAMNDDGEHIGGLVGFMKSMALLNRQFKPTRCVVVFDGKGGSARRKKMHKEYKEGRSMKFSLNRSESMPQDDDAARVSMQQQFAKLATYLRCLPITIISIDNIEADDVIAHLSRQVFAKEHQKITIVSSDKDFLQLVDKRIQVWSPTKKILFSPKEVFEKYGIPSHNFLMYRLFLGDNSDNIPGIKGVGDKTFKSKLPILLGEEVINVDQIVQYCKEKAEKTNIYQRILDQEQILHLNERLMQLADVDIGGSLKMNIENCVIQPVDAINKMEFKKMFMMDKLYSAIPNLDTWLSQSFDFLNACAHQSREKK